MSAQGCMLRLGVSTLFIHVLFSVPFSCPHTYKHIYEKNIYMILCDDDTLTYQIISGISLAPHSHGVTPPMFSPICI